MKKLHSICLLLVILASFNLSTSFPLAQVPSSKKKDEFQGISPQESGESKSFPLKTKELPWAMISEKQSSKGHVNRNNEDHVTRRTHHLPLASRDPRRYKPVSPNEQKSQMITALSIFGGCLAFMALAFAVTCVWYHRRENKRIKEATRVDVQSRHENVPAAVSMIPDAYIDVGKH